MRQDDVSSRSGADRGGRGAIRGRDAGTADQKPLLEGRAARIAPF